MNISEPLFQSIDLILQNRIADMKLDKTIKCTVKSKKEDSEYTYIVHADGGATFEAVADEGATYHDKEQVYVLIPADNGTKLILGRCQKEVPSLSLFNRKFSESFETEYSLSDTWNTITVPDDKDYRKVIIGVSIKDTDSFTIGYTINCENTVIVGEFTEADIFGKIQDFYLGFETIIETDNKIQSVVLTKPSNLTSNQLQFVKCRIGKN